MGENFATVCNLRSKLRKIFVASHQQVGQQNLIEATKKLYNQTGENKGDFIDEFLEALKYVLTYSEKADAEKVLSFVSKFAVSLYVVDQHSSIADDVEEETENEFVTALFTFLFKIHWSGSVNVRLRSVNLINSILTSMPENSFISCEMWKKLVDTIKNRIQDKNSSVRVAAVLAARKLQEPKNPKCQIITVLLFHLVDPAPAVRRAVVSSIAICKATIGQVLDRTLDVHENVRRNTFAALGKVRFSSFAIAHRITIIDRGLKDRSQKVVECCEKAIVRQWCESLNHNVIKLLEGLDVVNCQDIGALFLKSLLRLYTLEEIVKCLPIDEDSHLVPIEKITPEIALLWYCLCKHLCDQEKEEELEMLLPTLSVFCDYIKRFYPVENNENSDNIINNEDAIWQEIKKKRVLYNLLEMTKLFDYRDEMGRSSLQKMLLSFLGSSCIPLQMTEHLVEILKKTLPDSLEFLNALAKLIAELREPLVQVAAKTVPEHEEVENKLKISGLRANLNDLREQEYNAVLKKDYALAANLQSQIDEVSKELDQLNSPVEVVTFHERQEERSDTETMRRCLYIMFNMIRLGGISTLVPVIRGLHENLINPSMHSDDLLTQTVVVKVLAQCCVLDRQLAVDNLWKFIYTLSQDIEIELTIPALKAIFDTLQTHGLEIFDDLLDDETDANTQKVLSINSIDIDADSIEQTNNNKLRAKCMSVLKGLLQSPNSEMKAVAFDGLCKLLANGIIYSPSILKRIIIEGFTPVRGNEFEDRVRQRFMVFFPRFARATPRSQEMIEAAFVPIIRLLNDSPIGSPEADINPRDVASFLVEHTIPGINPTTPSSVHIHNNLATAICLQILRDVSLSTDLGFAQVYLKALLLLHLAFDNEAFAQQLKVLIVKVKKEANDTVVHKLINQFQQKVDTLMSKMLTSTTARESIQNTLQSKDFSSINHKPSLGGNTSPILEDVIVIDDSSSSLENEKQLNDSSISIVAESPEILD